MEKGESEEESKINNLIQKKILELGRNSGSCFPLPFPSFLFLFLLCSLGAVV